MKKFYFLRLMAVFVMVSFVVFSVPGNFVNYVNAAQAELSDKDKDRIERALDNLDPLDLKGINKVFNQFQKKGASQVMDFIIEYLDETDQDLSDTVLTMWESVDKDVSRFKQAMTEATKELTEEQKKIVDSRMKKQEDKKTQAMKDNDAQMDKLEGRMKEQSDWDRTHTQHCGAGKTWWSLNPGAEPPYGHNYPNGYDSAPDDTASSTGSSGVFGGGEDSTSAMGSAGTTTVGSSGKNTQAAQDTFGGNSNNDIPQCTFASDKAVTPEEKAAEQAKIDQEKADQALRDKKAAEVAARTAARKDNAAKLATARAAYKNADVVKAYKELAADELADRDARGNLTIGSFGPVLFEKLGLGEFDSSNADHINWASEAMNKLKKVK